MIAFGHTNQSVQSSHPWSSYVSNSHTAHQHCSYSTSPRILNKFSLLQQNTWQKKLKEGRASFGSQSESIFLPWGRRHGSKDLRQQARLQPHSGSQERWGLRLSSLSIHKMLRCTSRVCVLSPHLSQSGNSSQACTEVCLLVILDPVTLTIILSHCPCCTEYKSPLIWKNMKAYVYIFLKILFYLCGVYNIPRFVSDFNDLNLPCGS